MGWRLSRSAHIPQPILNKQPGNHTGFSDAKYDELVLGAKGKLSADPEKDGKHY